MKESETFEACNHCGEEVSAVDSIDWCEDCGVMEGNTVTTSWETGEEV